jgi:hypothetical protein
MELLLVRLTLSDRAPLLRIQRPFDDAEQASWLEELGIELRRAKEMTERLRVVAFLHRDLAKGEKRTNERCTARHGVSLGT